MTKPPPKSPERVQKESEALRANLVKRKAQQKTRGPAKGGFRTPQPQEKGE